MNEMTTKDDGGPAFPFAATDPSNVPMQAQGMALRDWFAGQALAGMCADPNLSGAADKWATQSYNLADAMIAARNGGAA
jgi:hypothetical protein